MKFKNIKIGDYIEAKKDIDSMINKGQSYEVVATDRVDIVAVCIPNVKHEWWVNPDNFRKPRTKLKKLDQSIFDGLDEKWRFAMVSSVGIPFVYDYRPNGIRAHFSDDATQQKIKDGNVMRIDEYGYDTTDWQNSLIERKAELKGSDLCRAMLARGDKYVLCGVSDNDDSDAADHESDDFLAEAVTDFYCKDELFGTTSMRWNYAVPINNQGKPLTARGVGL